MDRHIAYLPLTEHFSVFDKLGLLEKELEKIAVGFGSNLSADYLSKAREKIKQTMEEEKKYLFEYE